MAEETRRRVRQVADELGYRASPAARALRMRRSWSMGLIIPDIANPMYGEIARGAAEVLEEAGCTLLVASHDARPERQTSHVRNLLLQRVDGVILQPWSSCDEDVLQIVAAGVPLALLARSHLEQPTDHVLTDPRAPLLEGLSHLAELGHRRIAITLMGGRPSTSAQERFETYCDFMQTHFGAVDDALIVRLERTDLESGRAAVPALLASGPTAIVASNDLLALGVRGGLLSAGLLVPRDLSLLAVDDTYLSALPGIDLTSLELPKRQIGIVAARLILERIAEPRRPFQKIVLPAHLVVRQSTDVPPAHRN
jgi:LacI family transcriptional regulator